MVTQNTEHKIIQAAENEFIERGFSGARMQAIADKAGINKALLHYYFRSKQKLFEVIFKTVFRLFIPKIIGIFNNPDIDFFEKIKQFVSAYIELIIKNPHIPGFIIHELNSNDSALIKVISEIKPDISPVIKQIQDEIDKGNIIDIDPEHLILNILSMTIFPVVAAPIVKLILVDGDKSRYDKLFEERKTLVADFTINAIKINKSQAQGMKN